MVALSGSVIAALERKQKVLERESVSYDYEKVFWRSAWSFGLVGLGYLTLKFTGLLRSSQQALWRVSNIEVSDYFNLYDWVEGVYSDKEITDPAWASMIWGIKDPGALWEDHVTYYRENPVEWAEYKYDAFTKWPEYVNRDGSHRVDPTDKILDIVDRVGDRVLPVLPLGLLGFHVVSEKIRVRRMESELKDEQ